MALEREGEPVALPASKKTRALLGYLAANDRKVRRERLCEMFWEVPDDPRGALRWSLSKLRGLIDDEGGCRLVADREEVGLDCSALSVDWRTLRDVAAGDIRKVDTPVLEAATAAWGDFLEGLELPRCDDYQAWLIAMREDARKRFVALLRELVQRPIDPERALALGRLWTTLDPYDALARVALIDLLDRLGRRSEADQQRMLGTRKLDEADVPVPPSLRGAVAVSESAPPLPVQHVKFCSASDGTGLAYSIAGDGPPLVKTANWLNHLEQDWESPVWMAPALQVAFLTFGGWSGAVLCPAC